MAGAADVGSRRAACDQRRKKSLTAGRGDRYQWPDISGQRVGLRRRAVPVGSLVRVVQPLGGQRTCSSGTDVFIRHRRSARRTTLVTPPGAMTAPRNGTDMDSSTQALSEVPRITERD